MHNFERLEIWRRAMRLTRDVYRLTDTLPREEIYGLTSQLRRAVVSIPTNIAEGAGRRTPNDFGRFLSISVGSCNEVLTLLHLTNDLGFVDCEITAPLIAEATALRRMTHAVASSNGLTL